MNKYQINIPLPTGGINLIDDSLIADNEAAEGTVNITFRDGIPRSRAGYKKHMAHEFTTQPGTVYPWVHDGSFNILAAVGTKLKKDDNGAFVDVGDIASSNITVLTYPYKFADPDTYSDKAFILDGSTYLYTSGSSVVAVPAYSPTNDEITAYGTNTLSTNEVQKQKYILNDDNRIWVAGYGKLVRMSHIQQPDYFPSTHVWKLDEDCTGMTRFMGEVLLFTKNTATLISGSTPNFALPDKYVYKRLPGGFGCDAHKSISEGDNAVYWANKDGIYRYRYLPTGYSIPECVSEFKMQDGHTRSVKKWITAIPDWSKVHAEYINHEYRLYVGEKKVIIFNSLESTWTLYEYNKTFPCSMVYDNILFYGSNYIYHMDYPYDTSGTSKDGLSDDGNAISFVLKSKFFDFSKAANKKKFKKAYVTIYTELVSFDIDLIMNYDNEYDRFISAIVNKVSRMGELQFGDRINTKNTNLNYAIKLKHRGKKYNIQYELNLSELNMCFTLLSIVLLLNVKELK